MHFPSFLAIGAFGVLTTLSVAAPAHQEVLMPTDDPASSLAVTRVPTSYQLISRDLPNKAFPQNRVLQVSQANGGLSNIDTLLYFDGIPPGSFGCQLAISFSPNYPLALSGNSQLNVFKLSRNITKSDTYSTYFPQGGRGIPVGGFLFGTINPSTRKGIVNSGVCAPSLSFLVEIASDTAAGSVAFTDAGNPQVINGFFLTYD